MNEALIVGTVLLALSQILGFVVLLRKVSGVAEIRRIEPQPLEIKPSPVYMTREACAQMHAQTERFESARFATIETKLEELVEALDRRNTEGERRASRIHDRVDAVATGLSELRGQVNNHIEHGDHNAR